MSQHPGHVLREHMNMRGIGITRLGRLAGLSESTICNILSGKQEVSRYTAIKLAAAFNTTAVYWLRLQYAYNLFLLKKMEEAPVKGRWGNPADYGLEGLPMEELCEFLFGENSKASLLKPRRLK